MNEATVKRALRQLIKYKVTAYVYFIPETKELLVTSTKPFVVKNTARGNTLQLRYIVHSDPEKRNIMAMLRKRREQIRQQEEAIPNLDTQWCRVLYNGLKRDK